MDMRLTKIALAVVGGAASLALPATSEAATVGYYAVDGNGFCSTVQGDVEGTITANGHTLVSVTTLNSASLAPLDALVITVCWGTFSASADLNTAVSNGLGLVFDIQGPAGNVQTNIGSTLPGAPVLDWSGSLKLVDVSLAAGSPVTNGPGGTLTETNLDSLFGAGGETVLATFAASSLPAGAQPFLDSPTDPNQVGAFGYPQGAGRVAFSASSISYFLPGSGYPTSEVAGAPIYFTNALDWVLNPEAPATTCASEGYTGLKLTWCQNVCEKGYTGTQLNIWIKRWMDRYHDLPYCAREQAPPPPPPAE